MTQAETELLPIEFVMIPKPALDWLMGVSPDPAGLEFGEFPEDHPPNGAFWWRKTFQSIVDYYANHRRTPPEVSAEGVSDAPVAWRFRFSHFEGDEWEVIDRKPTFTPRTAPHAEVQPLYLRPSTPEVGSEAARDVLVERERQKMAEGWTPEHDDKHLRGEMALAAACYAITDWPSGDIAELVPSIWPWAEEWWKPKDYRRNLVRSAALILAEIERLDRRAVLK